MDETLTTEDAGKILCVDPQTLRRYAKEKRLKASKIGRRWVFKKEEVIRFFESLRNN